MSVALIIALVVVGGFALAVAVAIPTGRYLHRIGHRDGDVDPRDCPPWCVRKQAAALHDRPARRGAHRAPARGRIRHLIAVERKSR